MEQIGNINQLSIGDMLTSGMKKTTSSQSNFSDIMSSSTSSKQDSSKKGTFSESVHTAKAKLEDGNTSIRKSEQTGVTDTEDTMQEKVTDTKAPNETVSEEVAETVEALKEQIAGILSISSDYYEAASIDGANGWQGFWYITFPLLLPTLATTTVLNVIYGLKVFDMVYALTNGGPGKATTEVLYTAVFKKFGTGQYAVGTALSSVMFIIMIFVGSYMIHIMTKNEVVE